MEQTSKRTVRWAARRGRRRLGMSLVEAMISVTIFSMMMAGLMSTYIFIVKSTQRGVAISAASAKIRDAVERLSRDVRTAKSISSFSSTYLRLIDPNSSWILYYVDGGYLWREDASRKLRLFEVKTDFAFVGQDSTGTAQTAPASIDAISFSGTIVARDGGVSKDLFYRTSIIDLRNK